MADSKDAPEPSPPAGVTVHLVATLHGFRRGITQMVCSADGAGGAATDGQEVRLWHLTSAGQDQVAHALPVACNCLALAPDGHLLALPLVDGGVQLLSLAGGGETLILPSVLVADLCFSPDGHLLLISEQAGRVYGWDRDRQRLCATFQPTPEPRNPPRSATFLRWAPDGQRLVFCCESQHAGLQVWDLRQAADAALSAKGKREGHWVRALLSPTMVLNTPTFSPDGRLLAVAEYDESRIFLFDARSLEPITTLHESRTPGIEPWSIAFSPDGYWLAAALFNGWVQLWETGTWRLAQSFAAHGWTGQEEAAIETFCWGGNRSLLATGANYSDAECDPHRSAQGSVRE